MKSESIYLEVEKWHKNNFDSLGDKKFHFASRLYLWGNDEFSKERLVELKQEYIGIDKNAQEMKLRSFLNNKKREPAKTKIQKIRRPYYEKYPQLMSFDKILFRNLFCRTVYGIDLKGTIYKIGIKEDIIALRKILFDDKEAVKTLSTMAVNFFYTSRFILGDRFVEPEFFLELLLADWKRGKEYLHLRLYLATHAIIGESKFYAEPILYKKEIYVEIAKFAERLIADNFDNISLDIKFEFLVCVKMLDSSSVLESEIRKEAGKSLSQEGLFFVDKYNSNAGIAESFEKSEHRNVLAIMGSRKWQHT